MFEQTVDEYVTPFRCHVNCMFIRAG